METGRARNRVKERKIHRGRTGMASAKQTNKGNEEIRRWMEWGEGDGIVEDGESAHASKKQDELSEDVSMKVSLDESREMGRLRLI